VTPSLAEMDHLEWRGEWREGVQFHNVEFRRALLGQSQEHRAVHNPAELVRGSAGPFTLEPSMPARLELETLEKREQEHELSDSESEHALERMQLEAADGLQESQQ
jgi:hypothetical protein